MEPFPHLASILMLYIKPSKYHLLTDEHLNIFCELAAEVVSISNNDIVKSTITTTNSNNMNSSSPLSNSGIESSTPFHVPVSLTQCSVTMNGNNSNTKSCYPILSSHYTQAQTTISSQNSVNVLSNIVKNSDELSSVSVVVG
uniref:SJCHGC08861 protein n=1 Tax=Schistosoma japonicum TaxID=6182 RepID=Q5DH28_SCHJA|nr:SJCHGC08861 protein [Schistosoma japonicum]